MKTRNKVCQQKSQMKNGESKNEEFRIKGKIKKRD